MKMGKSKKEDKNHQKADDEKAPEVQVTVEEAAKPDQAAEALENRLLRLQADFDNFRKRVLRERNETYTKANEDLMLEIIPVLDHMDMAIKSGVEHGAPQAFVDGINLVADQLKGVLARFGLEKIDASGAAFDPNEHEAISHLPSGKVAENMVMEQTRLGYKLKGRLLRAAQVVVSSGSPVQQAEKKD